MTLRLRSLGALTAASVAASIYGASCGTSPVTVDGIFDDKQLTIVYSLSPLPSLPPSLGNHVADDLAAAALGRKLFFDTGLSGSGTISCATCHLPGQFFTDGKALSTGISQLSIHTPSVVGSQWSPFLNWDGRADSLWSQALGPLENEAEMAGTRLGVVQHIALNYRRPFEELFGPLPDLADSSRFPAKGLPIPSAPQHELAQAWNSMTAADHDLVNQAFANVGKAIEAYERKLVPGAAPFDLFVEAVQSGDNSGGGHLSEQARRGLEAFIGPAGCINCHNGPLLTDHGFHNIGLEPTGAPVDASPLAILSDLDRGRAVGAWKALGSPFRSDGRYGDAEVNEELLFLSPNFQDFEGAFRTPTLRNVASTAPYGHGGQHEDLSAVVEWYRDLPRVPMIGHRDLVLSLFDPSVKTADLVAFLESLTGPLPPKQWLSASGE